MSAAWWTTSCRVASSTARRVRSRPSPSVSPTQRTTITPIVWKSLVRRLTMAVRLRRGEELVAGSSHGADRLGSAELAPELCDVDVDRARAAGVRHAPYEVEQPLPREHDAGMLEEAREQVELLRRQLDRVAVDGDVARVATEDDRPHGEQLVRIARLGPTKDCLDPRRELARRERLRDVVVGPEFEARDAVGLLVARGEHDDRDLRVRAQHAAHLEAVDAGKADVEHDEPDGMPAQFCDRLLPGAEPQHAP